MISLRRPRLLQVAVPAHPSCAARVRRTVTEHLTRWHLCHLLDEAVLATSELFANAVRHAGTAPADSIALVLEHTEGELRVTLSDPSPLLPRPRTPDTAAESGRGLAIVAALADDWGTAPADPGTPGKKVWFSLATGERA
ncbi:ATP-binding protein [Streptomyces graminilatus]|uniref:ATP-binding protein n=1 Tax=Streptomyces graminilatus TaxID=1464070 RepID=UPI0006E1B1F1|nr:ATP-binding protein [Streptomyces graminilatus]